MAVSFASFETSATIIKVRIESYPLYNFTACLTHHQRARWAIKLPWRLIDEDDAKAFIINDPPVCPERDIVLMFL